MTIGARQLVIPGAGPDRGAIFSECRHWRYLLWERWGSGPYVLFVGANPSVADEARNDPTVAREIAFARAWGFDAYVKANIFAWVSTDPKGLLQAPDPVGPDNNRHLQNAAAHAGLVVACWGECAKVLKAGFTARAALVRRVLSRMDVTVKCFGTTKHGNPKHPLYLRKTTQLVPLG